MEKVCPLKALAPVAHFLQPSSTFLSSLFFFFLDFFSQDFCLRVPVFLSACYMCGYLQRPEDVGTSGTGITSCCETPDTGAGNQAWVPWESCECSQTPAHPAHPMRLFLLVIHWVWTRGWMKLAPHDLTSPQQHHQPGTRPWGYFIRTSYCLGRVHLGVRGRGLSLLPTEWHCNFPLFRNFHFVYSKC